ncbi:hypothetical protein D9M71_684020 [compost metagenome]
MQNSLGSLVAGNTCAHERNVVLDCFTNRRNFCGQVSRGHDVARLANNGDSRMPAQYLVQAYQRRRRCISRAGSRLGLLTGLADDPLIEKWVTLRNTHVQDRVDETLVQEITEGGSDSSTG